MKRLVFVILLGLLVSSAGALELRNVLWDRAFSPNGDEVQDEMPLSFMVSSEEGDLTLVRALVSSSNTVPPPEEDWVEVIVEMDSELGQFQNIETSWDGLDDGESPYPDGFYFLHIFASTESESFWMDPAGEIEINTIAPSFLSVAVEPQPFTPLLAGADTLQQIYFTSADFDTITDSATLEILAYSESAGQWYTVNQPSRDESFAQDLGYGVRYRILWDGTDTLGNRNDGVFPGILTLEDDAGNLSQAQVTLDLDILAPTLEVLDSDIWVEQDRGYYFNSESLPDSLMIRATDRSGLDSCVVAWGPEAPFDTLGIVQDSGDPEFEDFLFLLPEHWAADSTYHIYLDAKDQNGHWLSEIDGSPEELVLVIDNLAPETPVWQTQGGDRIQAFEDIHGSVFEDNQEIHLYRNGGEVAIDTTSAEGVLSFSFFVQLEDGQQSFRLRTFDLARNASGLSEELIIIYHPGAAINVPGRFRGDDGETIQINTPSAAERVELRFFSLDGALLRVLEATGGPDEWAADWNLLDDNGRELAPGLLALVIRSYLETGEVLVDRKVVALVD